jgi:surfeit locus 1 family protein
VRRYWLTALSAAFALLFAGLGVWQVERLQWKLDLIREVDARLAAAPRAIPPAEWPSVNAKSDTYRRVVARGRFLHDRETLTQALTEDGAGWWVMTPLRTRDGDILVNRGFVAEDHRDPATRPAPEGETTVTGLLRLSEPGGGFLRGNDPAAGRWYSRDVAAIARARGLERTAPFFIDADAATSPGYPRGGMTVVRFRNPHLVYALTWFGLMGICGFGTWLSLRRRARV